MPLDENLIQILNSITHTHWWETPQQDKPRIPVAVCCFKEALCYYYIPEIFFCFSPPELALFSEHAKQNAWIILPSLEIELDQLPKIKLIKNIFTPYGEMVIIAELKLTGSISIKNIHSDLNNFQIDAELTAEKFLASLSIDNINFDAGKISLSSSIAGDFWSTDFSVTPHSFSASAAPKSIEVNYLDYTIEGELGYELNGSYYYGPHFKKEQAEFIVFFAGAAATLVLKIREMMPAVEIGLALAA